MKIEDQYTSTDIIIRVQLTPGGPGSHNYDLRIMGNGNYQYASYYAVPQEKKIATKDIQAIIEQAKSINFTQLVEHKFKRFSRVNDGQQTNVGIWLDGYLRTGTFGHGNPMPTAVSALVKAVLALTDPPNRLINH